MANRANSSTLSIGSLFFLRRRHRRAVGDRSADQERVQQQVFWMRDPKTGNWIPETHFGRGEDVDVADLRAKLLSNPNKNSHPAP